MFQYFPGILEHPEDPVNLEDPGIPGILGILEPLEVPGILGIPENLEVLEILEDL